MNKPLPPLVEFVRDDHVNLKTIDKKWVGGWWVPVPREAQQYVLQAVRGAYLQGARDKATELRRVLNCDQPEESPSD